MIEDIFEKRMQVYKEKKEDIEKQKREDLKGYLMDELCNPEKHRLPSLEKIFWSLYGPRGKI